MSELIIPGVYPELSVETAPIVVKTPLASTSKHSQGVSPIHTLNEALKSTQYTDEQLFAMATDLCHSGIDPGEIAGVFLRYGITARWLIDFDEI